MSLKRVTPKRFLTDALPYASLLLGVLVPLVIKNVWAIGSGVLWLVIGAAVLWQRRSSGPVRRNSLVGLERKKSGATQLVWTPALNCGNGGIDEQHKRLFDTGNALLDAVHGKQGKEKTILLVDTLIDEVKSHFHSEEALLAAWNHPLTDEHKAVHEKLLNKAIEVRNKARANILSTKTVLAFLVDDLVYGHIASEDRKFFHEV